MKVTYKGRTVTVTDIEIEAEPVDCYIAAALYDDNGAELTDDELMDLTSRIDIYHVWLDRRIESADMLYDMER